jgi:rsbT co-antagonist protein RsbR
LEKMMSAAETTAIVKLVAGEEQTILAEWLDLQKSGGALATGRINAAELGALCRDFLRIFRDALSRGGVDVASSAYGPTREFLNGLSAARATQGFSPKETATFVFSLKRPLFDAMNRDKAMTPAALAQTIWAVTQLLDELGLHTIEAYQKSREEVIMRQRREITELSTPVVRLWDGVLALPIIGTLDSERTQVVMENLLQGIVDEGAEIAIIDITGVPTVDTLTAQHLLKTVAAARLMGADCIISGIRPQIAQTIVHLGVDLDVITKSSLADAFAVALRRTGQTVTKVKTRQAGDERERAARGA